MNKNPITECLYSVYEVGALVASPSTVLWAWERVAVQQGRDKANHALTDLNIVRERHGKAPVVVPYGYVLGVV